MKLMCAPAGDEGLFDRAWPMLARACHDAMMETVFADYAAGRAQLWLAFDGDIPRAAMITQSCGDTLHLWLCGGAASVAQWRELGAATADAARGTFRRLTIDGRRGWARVLGFARAADGMVERIV